MPLILPKFVAQPMAILVTRIVDTESLSVDLQAHPEHDRGHPRLGDRPRPDDALRGPAPADAEVVRHLQSGAPARLGRGRRPRRLLLVDDTPFFLEVVKRYLTAEGHEVETAVNGEEGLARLAAGRPFDLIVSDIEMPVMDGWEFARETRRRGIKTPMLALTSLSGVAYEIKARDCGYDSYEVKLDHDRLVRKVGNLLAAQELQA